MPTDLTLLPSRTTDTDALTSDANDCADVPRHEQVLAFIRARTEAGTGATRLALQQHLRSGQKAMQLVLEALSGQGHIVHIGRRAGWVVPNTVVGDVTLRDLVVRAADCVDHKYLARPGSRTRGRSAVSRRVERLSPTQFAKVKTAASAVASMCSPDHDRTALGAVHLGDLTWDQTANEWSIIPRLRAWSRSRPGSTDAATIAHVDGMRLLLDLAATRGWLSRTGVDVRSFEVHAAEWEPWLRTSLELLTAPTISRSGRSRVSVGLHEIAAMATRLCFPTPAKTDWPTLAATMATERKKSPPHREEKLKLASSAFNRLVDAGAIMSPYIGGRRSGRQRDGLVSMEAIRAAIEDGDWSGWCDAEGRPFRTLLEGPYSIPRYIAWLDARVPASALTARGLPPRTPAVESDIEAQRRAIRKRKAGKAWFERRKSSLNQRLKHMNVLAGFAETALGFDWTSPDENLLHLVESSLAHEYAAYWARAHGRDVHKVESTQVRSVTEALAHFAAPFASGVAKLNANLSLADHLIERHRELILLVEEFSPSPDLRARLREKVAAWTEGDPERAEQRLEQLEALLTARICAEAEGRSLEAQVCDIESGKVSFRMSVHWQSAVRDAAAFAMWRRIPLRSHNLATLHLHEEWRASGPRPWEGQIRVSITELARLKTRNAQSSWLIKRAGDPDVERQFPRVLFQLYLMPGGARERLLDGPSGQVESPYLFVSDARTACRKRGAARRLRDGLPWRSCSAVFERWVRRHALELGLDLGRMPRGAKRAHILRHLTATLWESRGLGEYGRSLLGHASASDTAGMHYVSPDAYDLAPEEARERAQRASVARMVAHNCTHETASGLTALTQTRRQTAGVESGPECRYCYEPLPVRSGKVALKCRACGEWQADP